MWKKTTAGIIATATLAGGTVAADRTIDPYQDRGQVLDMYVESVNKTPDRVEIRKNKPEVALTRWNNEETLVLTREGSHESADRPFLSNKMEWSSPQEKAVLEPVEGGFKFDVILYERPQTDTVCWQVENWDNFNWYYQPELTQEEIDQGAERPENVVGSLAVYHKTKTNNCTNCGDVRVERELVKSNGDVEITRIKATNYNNGKFTHVFAPYIWEVGDDENKTKATLSFDEGSLCVNPPKGYFDTADFSEGVRIDPTFTFGYESPGASQRRILAVAQFNSVLDYNRVGGSFTLAEAGTLDSIHVQLSANSSYTYNVDMKANVNREDSAGAGSHDEVVSVENTSQSITTTPTFITFTGSSEALTADDYVLNTWGNGVDMPGGGFGDPNSEIFVAYDSGGSDPDYVETSGSLFGGYSILDEDPWTNTDASNGYIYSMYVTYTASAGGSTPTVTPSAIIFD